MWHRTRSLTLPINHSKVLFPSLDPISHCFARHFVTVILITKCVLVLVGNEVYPMTFSCSSCCADGGGPADERCPACSEEDYGEVHGHVPYHPLLQLHK